MTRDGSTARKPTGKTVPRAMGISPKMSPGWRTPTARAMPSTCWTGSIFPASTANSARSLPWSAAYSPGASLMSAATRDSRSRCAGSRAAKRATCPISSAVTTARACRTARRESTRAERREVLAQVLDRQRARDRQHDGRAPQEPGELVRVGAVPAQRVVRHERDPFALAVVHDVVVAAVGDVVAVLHGRDRHDPAGLLDLVHGDLGDPHVADRAAVDVRLDRAEALLERRLRVDPVEVVEADRVRAQRAQALLDLGLQHLGPALAGAAVAALGRDEDVVARALERLADRALALAARVEVRGVDVAHPRGDGVADEGRVDRAQAVGAEADPGDVDAGEAERCS